MARAPVRLEVAGEIFAVRVTPNSRAALLIVDEDADGNQRIVAHVTVPPEDGKANKAVIALLARALGVPKSALSIARGAKARDKLIRVLRND